MTPAPTDARERLIAAAQQLYAADGVAATTPRQVLARSGIGQGSLYHHFPAKRDLAAAAVARTAQEALDTATAPLTADAPAHDRVLGYLRRDRDAVAGCRVGRLTADPLVMSDEELRGSVGDYFTGLIDALTAAFAAEGLAPVAARDRATTAAAVIQGGYVLSRALGDPTHMRRAVDGLVDLLDGDAG